MTKEIKSKIQKIINFYNYGDYDKVIELSEIFLKKNPESDFILNLLGLANQKKSKFDSAEKILNLAHQINPENLSVLNNLANNFKYKFDFKRAKELYVIVLKKDPNNGSALLNYGNLEFTLNNNIEALELLKKALKINNKLIPVHLNLAITYQSLGNFKKAKEHLEIINTLKPEFTRSDKMISVLTNYNNEKDHLNKMLQKLENLKLDNQEKIYLYFGIGKAYEDLGNFSNAYKYIKLGNKLKRESLNYTIKKDHTLIKAIKKKFEEYRPKKNNLGDNKLKPIFILGMPRSGTTLIEQIISSHKKVKGLGEINFFNRISENELYKHNFSHIYIKKKYSNLISNFKIDEEKYVDKTLLNFLWIGFIKLSFPEAKVINCFRNPHDNCFSIYKNLFDYEGAWCYDENELVDFYKIYEDMIGYWQNKLPKFIYNVEYEKIVNKTEDEIKKLISYCDLEWDKNCLEFYNNKTTIKTLSVNQARKKIYSSSINSFEKFKEISGNLFTNL